MAWWSFEPLWLQVALGKALKARVPGLCSLFGWPTTSFIPFYFLLVSGLDYFSGKPKVPFIYIYIYIYFLFGTAHPLEGERGRAPQAVRLHVRIQKWRVALGKLCGQLRLQSVIQDAALFGSGVIRRVEKSEVPGAYQLGGKSPTHSQRS